VEFNFSLEVFTKLKALAKSVSLLASSIFSNHLATLSLLCPSPCQLLDPPLI